MNGYRHQQRGFSLIELMIGLTIGLLILLGVVTVYLSSIRSQATSESLARVQESGRFASYLMAREIRQAGYLGGCPGTINNLLDTSSSEYEAALFELDSAIEGWAGEAGALAARIPDYRGGDVLLIKHAALDSGVDAKGPGVIQAATVNIEQAKSGIEAGTILLLADAFGCDLFQKTNNANSPGLVRGAGGTPGNRNNAQWSHVYGEDMQILRYQARLYYIGADSSGQPALKQYVMDPVRAGAADPLGGHFELVSGVEDMRLMYGLDTDNDRHLDSTIDAFVPADQVNDWNQVVAVQISLLVSSRADPMQELTQSLTWPFDADGDGNLDAIALPDDGRMRSVFSTIVAVRNRLP